MISETCDFKVHSGQKTTLPNIRLTNQSMTGIEIFYWCLPITLITLIFFITMTSASHGDKENSFKWKPKVKLFSWTASVVNSTKMRERDGWKISQRVYFRTIQRRHSCQMGRDWSLPFCVLQILADPRDSPQETTWYQNSNLLIGGFACLLGS